jgi:proton-coupled amino acid transporter
MKGFVCVGVLYVPKAFINGGWLFTMGALTASAICTCYCSHLLLDSKKAIKAESYTALGKACFGSAGEMLVNLTIGSSQIGFTIGFIYFIKANLHEIFQQAFKASVNGNWFCLGQFVLFVGLCLVRKI